MSPDRTAALRVSFVIPALNEERGIGSTLDAIRSVMPPDIPYEIVVADHGSTDRTVEVARARRARTEVFRGGSIGSLRNRAVEKAKGEVLVFLDADVHVTPAWAEHLPHALDRIEDDRQVVTGSGCQISAEPSWLERTWFQPRKRHSHLGTGHMILSRALFKELGGFDPGLETGEDYEFSVRLKNHGGTLAPDPQLLVHHEGFPKTLRAFFWREAWHGRGDFTSLRTLFQSRVALFTLAFLGFHLVTLAGLGLREAWVLAAGLAGIGLICMVSAAYKFGVRNPGDAIRGTVLYYVYYWGRALSIPGFGGRVR